MDIKKSDLKPYEGNLIGFSGKHVPFESLIRLRVILGTWPSTVDMNVDFLMVDAPNTVYNAIMGRTSLDRAQAIVSTPSLVNVVPNPKRDRISLSRLGSCMPMLHGKSKRQAGKPKSYKNE